MKISLLNEKIQFQKAIVVSDGIGNRKNDWEEYYSCYATICGETGSEKSVAGLTTEDMDIAFAVRWCNAISVINSKKYRILFKGEPYNILQVDHINYKKKSVKFKCQKVRR